MAVGGGVEAVEGIDHGADGGIESEGHGGGREVVIDRFGDANHGEAIAHELHAGGERAIATDDDEGADFEELQSGLGLVDDLLGDFGDVAFSDFGGEVTFVGGAKDGAALLEDAGHFLGLEHHVVAGRE